LADMEKETGKGTGKIQIKADETLKNGHFVHLVHTPNSPNSLQQKLDRVRVVYWHKDWSFLASCKVRRSKKTKRKSQPLSKLARP